MTKVCREVATGSFMAGGDGNISVRLESGIFLVTPTASDKTRLTEAEPLELDASGRVIHGLGRPSAEAAMHLAAYAARPEAGAVAHSHSPLVCAWAISRGQPPVEALPEVPYQWFIPARLFRRREMGRAGINPTPAKISPVLT